MHPGLRRRRSQGPVSQDQIDEAMSTPTELTFWTWVPDIEDEVALFEEEYPAIDVTVENVGQGLPHYQKLRSAIEAGEGAPDVAQIEYQYIPSFVLPESLLDLTPYGADDLSGDYVDWAWNQVSPADEVWAIPQDVGPMGNLYREDILAQAGITEPPATYEEYATAAKAVKDATGSYISNLGATQAGQMIGFFWQAGVKPFGYDGEETVKIEVNSDGAKEVASYWTDLIQQDLISTDVDFNDSWYQGLASGKYAGWLTAAWAPVFLQGTAESTSGLWRAAPLPQWTAGEEVSGNWADPPTRCSHRARTPSRPTSSRSSSTTTRRRRCSSRPSSSCSRRRCRCSKTPSSSTSSPSSTAARRSTSSSPRSPRPSTRTSSGCRSWTTCTPATRRRWAPSSPTRATSPRRSTRGRTSS